MVDFSKIENQEIAMKVKKEVQDFVGHFHFGVQGIDKTYDDVKAVMNRMLAEDVKPFAFDTEITFVPMLKHYLGDEYRLHCAVSYPTGRMTLKKKLGDLEKLDRAGVRDVCVVLDWQALFSGRYGDLEKEAAAIMKEFGHTFDKNAFVIPATLMSDTALIDTCKALDQAGVESIKVNPGCKLNVSFEEVALIKRNFPNRFDIHPSGGIRYLSEAERYMEMGCQIVHSAACLNIADEFARRQLKRYGAM